MCDYVINDKFVKFRSIMYDYVVKLV